MPRNSSGTYSLYTPGNPVVTGTVISSTWGNNTLADIASALTDSLSRTGDGGMQAPLELDDGAVGAPALTWATETTSGLYRNAAGDFRFSVSAADSFAFGAQGGLVPNGTVLLPSLSFINDPDSGLYRIGANNIGVAVNAAKVLDVATTGLGVTGVFSATGLGTFSDGITVADNGRTQFSVLSTALVFGNVTDNPTYTFTGTGALTITPATTITGVLAVNNQITPGSSIAALVTNSASSQIYATSGAGAGDFAEAGNLMLQPRSSAARDIVLFTGSTSPTERLRILRTGETRAAGQVQLVAGSASAPGVGFSTDTNTGVYLGATDDLWMAMGGTGYPIGYRGMPSRSITTSDSTAATDNGRSILFTGAGSQTFTVDSDFGTAANICVILNGGTGALSIAESLSGTMTWLNGSGTLATGTRSLAIGGIATIWMSDANNAYVWGTGLS